MTLPSTDRSLSGERVSMVAHLHNAHDAPRESVAAVQSKRTNMMKYKSGVASMLSEIDAK